MSKSEINEKSGQGFTLMELMVVVTIMILLATAMVINLAGQRTARDIVIAQNQLVSYIRQAQSYTLSARVVPTGQAAQFYLLKFDLSKPTQYTIQALYNVSSSPQLVDIQTINLPANIRLAAVSPASISRQLNPTTQTPAACALAAFVAPFGKVIFNNGCASNNWSVSPGNYDDYEKIINFQVSEACDVNNSPPICSASTDSLMLITLTDASNTMTKKVLINGITGSVCPTTSATSCPAAY